MNKKLLQLTLSGLLISSGLCSAQEQVSTAQGWGWKTPFTAIKERASRAYYGVDTKAFPVKFSVNNQPGNQVISIYNFRTKIKEIGTRSGPKIRGARGIDIDTRREKIGLIHTEQSELSQAYDRDDTEEIERLMKEMPQLKEMPQQNLFGDSPIGGSLSQIIPEAGTKITFNVSQYVNLLEKLTNSVNFLLKDPSIERDQKDQLRALLESVSKLNQSAQKILNGLATGTSAITLDLDETQAVFRAWSDFYYTFATMFELPIIQDMLTRPVTFKMPPETANSLGQWAKDNRGFWSKYGKLLAGVGLIAGAALAWKNKEVIQDTWENFKRPEVSRTAPEVSTPGYGERIRGYLPSSSRPEWLKAPSMPEGDYQQYLPSGKAAMIGAAGAIGPGIVGITTYQDYKARQAQKKIDEGQAELQELTTK